MFQKLYMNEVIIFRLTNLGLKSSLSFLCLLYV